MTVTIDNKLSHFHVLTCRHVLEVYRVLLFKHWLSHVFCYWLLKTASILVLARWPLAVQHAIVEFITE